MGEGMKKEIEDIVDRTVGLSNTDRYLLVDVILATTGKERKLRNHIQQLLESGIEIQSQDIPEGMAAEDYHAQFDCVESRPEMEAIHYKEHLCGKCIYIHLCKGHDALKDLEILPTVTRCLAYTKRE
jgi:hypothetical protein